MICHCLLDVYVGFYLTRKYYESILFLRNNIWVNSLIEEKLGMEQNYFFQNWEKKKKKFFSEISREMTSSFSPFENFQRKTFCKDQEFSKMVTRHQVLINFFSSEFKGIFKLGPKNAFKAYRKEISWMNLIC